LLTGDHTQRTIREAEEKGLGHDSGMADCDMEFGLTGYLQECAYDIEGASLIIYLHGAYALPTRSAQNNAVRMT
jgi:hypothetical protein